MTKSFDEWFNTYENLQCDKDACEDAFEAGQQSKQAEVDDLKKRIDEALHEADESCGVSVDAFVKLNRILKGDSHES